MAIGSIGRPPHRIAERTGRKAQRIFGLYLTVLRRSSAVMEHGRRLYEQTVNAGEGKVIF